MKIKIRILSLLSLLIVGAGCTRSFSPSPIVAQNGLISPTLEPQEAQFNIGAGYIGGAGSMPVLIPGSNEPQLFDRDVIYFDESYSDVVRGRLLRCPDGYQPPIAVSANITLKKISGGGATAPGTPPQFHYEAKVNQLHSVTVGECKK